MCHQRREAHCSRGTRFQSRITFVLLGWIEDEQYAVALNDLRLMSLKQDKSPGIEANNV